MPSQCALVLWDAQSTLPWQVGRNRHSHSIPHCPTLCHTPLVSTAVSTNPIWDWVTDLASDVPQWALEQGSVGFESAQALLGVSRWAGVMLTASHRVAQVL